MPTSNAPAGSDGEYENVAPAKQSVAFKLAMLGRLTHCARNDSTHTNVSDRGQNPRTVSGAHKKQTVDHGKKHVVVEESVEDIAAFYNDQFGEGSVEVMQGSAEVSVHAGRKDDESIHFGNENQARAENSPEHASKTVEDANASGISKGTADSASPNVGQKDHDSVQSGYENQEYNSTSSTSYRNKERHGDANLTTTEDVDLDSNLDASIVIPAEPLAIVTI
ncbi:unnamed protein product [Cochlearia groenlandica]